MIIIRSNERQFILLAGGNFVRFKSLENDGLQYNFLGN